MFNKLFKISIYIFFVSSIFLGCSSRKKTDTAINNQKKAESSNTVETSTINKTLEFSNKQLNYEIKKLNAEINYLKEQVTALDVKSSLYADPFDIYNKEIILNNGSSIFCKILSQDDQEIVVETLIGQLIIDRNTIVRVVNQISAYGGLEQNAENMNEIIQD